MQYIWVDVAPARKRNTNTLSRLSSLRLRPPFSQTVRREAPGISRLHNFESHQVWQTVYQMFTISIIVPITFCRQRSFQGEGSCTTMGRRFVSIVLPIYDTMCPYAYIAYGAYWMYTLSVASLLAGPVICQEPRGTHATNLLQARREFLLALFRFIHFQ